MLELAKRVIELTGSPSGLDFHPLPVDDPVRRRPDLTQARERLGWEPTTDLATGLARTIDFFRRLLRPAARDAFR